MNLKKAHPKDGKQLKSSSMISYEDAQNLCYNSAKVYGNKMTR